MKLTKSQCQDVLNALSTLDGQPVGIIPGEIKTMCRKMCALRDSVKLPQDTVEVVLNKREEDIFLISAREILAEKHFAYSELPAETGHTKEELKKEWSEIARLMGQKL